MVIAFSFVFVDFCNSCKALIILEIGSIEAVPRSKIAFISLIGNETRVSDRKLKHLEPQ